MADLQGNDDANVTLSDHSISQMITAISEEGGPASASQSPSILAAVSQESSSGSASPTISGADEEIERLLTIREQLANPTCREELLSLGPESKTMVDSRTARRKMSANPGLVANPGISSIQLALLHRILSSVREILPELHRQCSLLNDPLVWQMAVDRAAIRDFVAWAIAHIKEVDDLLEVAGFLRDALECLRSLLSGVLVLGFAVVVKLAPAAAAGTWCELIDS